MERVLYKSIKGNGVTMASYLKEVWQSRVLALTFALRDLKIQYAQTFLGLLWSLVQPLTGLLIYTFFFQRLIHIEVDAPYPVFVFTGIMGWHGFSALVVQSGAVLMNNQQLIRKIHFPRLILPLSKMLAGLIEFGIYLALLLVLLLATGYGVSWKIIFLPFVFIISSIVALSIGIWLSALTIRFRDFHHIIPYLIGFGIWFTPVFYPTTLIPQQYSWVYYFHPVANVIALYRWIFINGQIDVAQCAVSFALAFVMFIAGLKYFIKNEKYIADYL